MLDNNINEHGYAWRLYMKRMLRSRECGQLLAIGGIKLTNLEKCQFLLRSTSKLCRF